jgi:hypothetical protein
MPSGPPKKNTLKRRIRLERRPSKTAEPATLSAIGIPSHPATQTSGMPSTMLKSLSITEFLKSWSCWQAISQFRLGVDKKHFS